MRLQESILILLSVGQGKQRGDLVGVKGTFALQDGSKSCTRSGGWKMKQEQGPERKCTLVEKVTSHKEWPCKGRSLRETLQAPISTGSWTLSSLKPRMQRGLSRLLWLCLVSRERCCLFPLSQPSTSRGEGFHTELDFIPKDPISPGFGEQNAQAVKLDSNSLLLSRDHYPVLCFIFPSLCPQGPHENTSFNTFFEHVLPFFLKLFWIFS